MNKEQIKAAREWLKDLLFADVDEDDIAAMPDARIIKAVARFYDGGIPAFLATC